MAKEKEKVKLEKAKTVQMRFPKDMYYRDLNVPLYKGGEVVHVPEQLVSRWLKRGGVLIADEVAGRAPVAPIKPPEAVVEDSGLAIDEDDKAKSEKK